jgi:predicted nucleotidyltransferase component of viral defense system
LIARSTRPGRVREYATPSAFRAAVEATLRERARRLGVAAFVLRRQAALERLLVRLSKTAPEQWVIKGGLALAARLGERARVSVDLDADHLLGAEAARADLLRAALAEVDDHFAFAVVGSDDLHEGSVKLAVRYKLESALAGSPFEPLQVDVTLEPADPADAERVRPGTLLESLGLSSGEVILTSLERQVAEKLHAYSRTYGSGGTTRAKDLVDLLLIRQYGELGDARLGDTIGRVFSQRGTHPVPVQVPLPPRDLAVAYHREAGRLGLPPTLGDAHRLLSTWLDPVLSEIQRRLSNDTSGG